MAFLTILICKQNPNKISLSWLLPKDSRWVTISNVQAQRIAKITSFCICPYSHCQQNKIDHDNITALLNLLLIVICPKKKHPGTNKTNPFSWTNATHFSTTSKDKTAWTPTSENQSGEIPTIQTYRWQLHQLKSILK